MTVLRAACDLLFAFAGDKEAFMGTGRERKGKFPSGGWCTGLFPTSKEEGSWRKSFCWFLVIPESFSCWARNLSALWLLLPFSYPHCLPIRPRPHASPETVSAGPKASAETQPRGPLVPRRGGIAPWWSLGARAAPVLRGKREPRLRCQEVPAMGPRPRCFPLNLGDFLRILPQRLLAVEKSACDLFLWLKTSGGQLL